MWDALKQVGILLRDVLSNDQAVVHAFVIKSFEYTKHVLFKSLKGILCSGKLSLR